MVMNRGRIFRRHRFDLRADRLQDTAGKVRGQAAALAGQARDGLERGWDALASVERTLARKMEENPVLILAGMALAGLLVAKWIVDRREERW